MNGRGGGKKKKDSGRWLFSQIVVIRTFTENPDSYPASEIPKPWMWKCGIRMKIMI